jgi:hypothetical protein
MALPLATDFLSEPGSLRRPFAAVFVTSVLVGAASFPGYYRAWLRREFVREVRASIRLWVRLSLGAAVVSGLAGAVMGALLLVPGILAFLYAAGAAMLWVQVERRG